MTSKNQYKMHDKLDWGMDATFVPNKRMPVYNWFYYKEGFSRQMVFNALEMLGAGKSRKAFVLDPFCGVGTTNLACRERVINSVGFDVSPIALFAARVKCRDYKPAKLKETLAALREAHFEPHDMSWIPGDIARFFNPHTLDDIVFFGRELK